MFSTGSALVAFLLLLIAAYLTFWKEFLRFFVDRLFQAVILVFFFALIYGQVGRSLGLPLQFWSEEPLTRLFVAFCSTLLLAVIGVNAYYLVPEERYHTLMAKIFGFLYEPFPAVNWYGSEHPPKDKVLKWAKARANGDLPAYRKVLGWVSCVVFFDSILEVKEPKKVQNQGPEEPYSNACKLSRFLRLLGLPFLTLLILPAVVPRVFINLPRFAPIVADIQSRDFHNFLGKTDPDIVQYWPAYLYALAVWATGIGLGVLAVKGFVKFSLAFYDGPERRSRSVAIYALFVAVVFGLMASYPIYDGGWLRTTPTKFEGVAPAPAILILLAALSLANVLLRYFVPSWGRLVMLVVILAIVSWSNWASNSFRFENLDYCTDKQQPNKFRYEIRERIEQLYLSKAERGMLEGMDEKVGEAPHNWEPLLDNVKTLNAWRDHCKGRAGSPNEKPKLVVVCTSGGAIRAGYWTATVLDRLGQEIPRQKDMNAAFDGDFHSHIRVITGASGGMLGASYYVTWLRDQAGLGNPAKGALKLSKTNWVEEIPIFGLRRVARFIALRDSLLAVGRRFVNWCGAFPDRGRELEADWTHIRYPLSNLKPFEEQGRLPSLIFSPLTVEDGRRLLISNLDLNLNRFHLHLLKSWKDFSRVPTSPRNLVIVGEDNHLLHIRIFDDGGIVTDTDENKLRPTLNTPRGRALDTVKQKYQDWSNGRVLTDADEAQVVGEATSIVGLGPVSRLPVNRASLVGTAFEPEKSAPVSITGVEFFKVFSSKEKNNIYLSTAARMSASFPYVSPAVNLPTDPPLRVVDAGYYDNYGVDLATSWLFANRKWIIENTSGVLIVQIRDAISTHDRFGYSDTNSNYANWLSGLQFFFSPVDAVLSARSASSSFRNDALISGLSDYFSEKTKQREFLTTASFELSSPVIQASRTRTWDWPGDRIDQKIGLADSSQCTDVSMSWYLSVAERQAIDEAIPYDRADHYPQLFA